MSSCGDHLISGLQYTAVLSDKGNVTTFLESENDTQKEKRSVVISVLAAVLRGKLKVGFGRPKWPSTSVGSPKSRYRATQHLIF